MKKVNLILGVVILGCMGFVGFKAYQEGIFERKSVSEKIDGKQPDSVFVYENKASKYKVAIPGNWGVSEAGGDQYFESRAKFVPAEANLKVTSIEIEVLNKGSRVPDFFSQADFEKWEKVGNNQAMSGVTKVGEELADGRKILLLADLSKASEATASSWMLTGWLRDRERNMYIKMNGRGSFEETDEQVFRYLLGTLEVE